MAFTIRKIEVITTKDKKVGEMAAVLITGKTFVGRHEVADASNRIAEVGFQKVDLREKPKGINEKNKKKNFKRVD